MKKALLVSLTLILAYSGKAQDEIIGGWSTPDGNMIVEVYASEPDLYAGKIVWLEKPTDKNGSPHKDRMNPEKSLRDRTLLGMDMLENLKYKNGKWYGTLYSPKKGRKVDAELSLVEGDQLDIKVSFRGFSRTLAWTRTALPK